MKRGLSWICAVAFVGASGCATAYGPMGYSGGYKDAQLNADVYRVEFRGNGYTSRETVELYLHYRCAELTVQSGYDWFVLLSGGSDARAGSYTAPGHYTGQTSATGGSTGTYTPGTSYTWTKYGATAMMRVFKGKKPNDAFVAAFDAHEVLRYLGPRVRNDQQTK